MAAIGFLEVKQVPVAETRASGPDGGNTEG
jgi:hypothetical protein